MKKFFKIFILMIVIIPAMFFTGCVKEDDLDSLKIVSIEQIETSNDAVTYKITYEDGSTFTYDVPLNLENVKIVDIKRTNVTADTVTYTIEYEDGSTFSYDVPLNDVVSIETIAKTSSSNNIDTYTITLTNGDTHTFDVTHGVTVTEISYDRTEGLKDYYTIRYNNGNTTEFYVTNGEDGKSITSIAFSHSEGLIDYYTITYSDKTSTQFSVTNGSDGITLDDLYEAVNVDGKYNNVLEFIEDYLSINVSNNTTVATGKAIMSAVSVYAFSPVSGSYYEYKYGSENYYSVSAGSGVIYQLDKEKGDAYIITNCHVVYSENNAMKTDFATKVSCYLYGQESAYYLEEENDDYIYDENEYPVINFGKYGIECEIIGASTKYDIAVLKVTNSEVLKNSNVKQIEIADSDKVILSEDAIAVGNPDAAGLSVTQGVISVLSEYIDVSIDSTELSTLREFRIDTAVNSGNSGGGLFNASGELIGIVNAKTSNSSLENFGYAIPSNIAINVADNMIYYHETEGQMALKKAYIGITLGLKSSKTQYNAETLTTEIIEEVEIAYVEERSIAQDKFGLKVGDIIKNVTIFDGTTTTVYNITRYHQVIDLILKVRAGDSVTFSCISEGNPIGYTYTIQESDLRMIY